MNDEYLSSVTLFGQIMIFRCQQNIDKVDSTISKINCVEINILK